MDSPFGSSVSKALGGILAGLPIGSEEVRTASFLRSRFTGRLDDERTRDRRVIESDAGLERRRTATRSASRGRRLANARYRMFSVQSVFRDLRCDRGIEAKSESTERAGFDVLVRMEFHDARSRGEDLITRDHVRATEGSRDESKLARTE